MRSIVLPRPSTSPEPRITLRSLWNSLVSRRYSPRHFAFAALAFIVLVLFYVVTPGSDDSFKSVRWSPTRPSYPKSHIPPRTWERRAEQVKQAFVHAYRGYEQHASPHDELRPLSNSTSDTFNGWGVTMYDSLDTMLLMGLHDEFARTLPVIRDANFSMTPLVSSEKSRRPRLTYAPFFETVIRYLGGLLSAYALTNEQVLLERADDLGRMLAPAFDTPSRLPMFSVNTDSGTTFGASVGILAEIGSCQMEYAYLAHATGKREHFFKADDVMNVLVHADLDRQAGMLPKRWNLTDGQPVDDSLSVGAAADSAHEYLLKQYLLTAKDDPAYLQMYLRTTNYILTHLLYLSPKRKLLYVTDTTTSMFVPTHKLEHLSCFLPGLLALGVHSLPISLSILDPSTLGPEALRTYNFLLPFDLRTLHMWAAEGLATTCWLMYADQPSGLAPDELMFRSRQTGREPGSFGMGFGGMRGGADITRGGLWMDAMERWRAMGRKNTPPGMEEKLPMRYSREERSKGADPLRRDYSVIKSEYLLRPETIESFYILWRTTGNPVWRERGWAIFEAIEREAKTPSGYAALLTVQDSPAPKKDIMPSFFLAETLKYLYLMFREDDLLPLDKWVFNTEAHPFPVFAWPPWQRSKFGMTESNHS